MHPRSMALVAAGLALPLLTVGAAAQPPGGDPAAEARHVAAAKALAANNPDVSLSSCQARPPRPPVPGTTMVRPPNAKSRVFLDGAASPPFPPTKVFDNLYY